MSRLGTACPRGRPVRSPRAGSRRRASTRCGLPTREARPHRTPPPTRPGKRSRWIAAARSRGCVRPVLRLIMPVRERMASSRNGDNAAAGAAGARPGTVGCHVSCQRFHSASVGSATTTSSTWRAASMRSSMTFDGYTPSTARAAGGIHRAVCFVSNVIEPRPIVTDSPFLSAFDGPSPIACGMKPHSTCRFVGR